MTDFLQIPKNTDFSREIEESVRALGKTVVYNAAFAHKAAIGAFFARKCVWITLDSRYAETVEILAQMGVRVLSLDPVYDVVMHRTSVNLSTVGRRLESLIALHKGEYDIVVITPKVLTQYLPQRGELAKSLITVSEKDELDGEEFAEKLSHLGYKRVPRAEEKGDVAVFGEVIEVFPPDSEMPVRIMMDFDRVSSIKYYQPETMQGAARKQSVTFPPVSDLLADISMQEVVRRLHEPIGLQSAKAAMRSGEILNDLELRLSRGGISPAFVWLIPYIKDKLSTFFDYLPTDALFIMDEPTEVFDALSGVERTHEARVLELVKSGDALKKHLFSILQMEEVNRSLGAFDRLGFTAVNAGMSAADKGYFVADSAPLPAYFRDTAMMIKDVAEYLARGYLVRLYCGSEENVSFMRSFLGELAVEYSPARLQHGFISSRFKSMIVGTADMCLSTVQKITKSQIKRRSIAPKAGDYVVHEEYGIGRCLGIVHQKTYVGEKDYLALEYARQTKVYVPVQQMDMLELYAGAESAPKLSDISKDEFGKHKSKARAAVKKLAFDLLELYAKREKSQGYRYPSDTPLQVEFERAFEFEETPDQLQAVAEIKEDMEKGRVMDRLICGDVGFGKTEVALRAIFKTIMENKQVAFLAPTTILTEQHFMTVSSRLTPFGIRVACLNRFRTAAQSKEILRDLKNGTLSVVVGTHRLLSKDVDFYDLGLLVLDEEQRFGVEHKEKIKTLRNNVNVLSLSATPIPRTLYMALSGIRDVSLLDTPPKGRRPVDAVVGEYSDGLLQDAVHAELNRGGQVFVLYNSVEKIYALYAHLQKLFPEARIVVAHGQMNTKELESNIFSFYKKDADILLATTIIENGIDVPNANTLFVVEANKLGLSQMYQLKGRVGRSTRLAHAYFTYPSGYLPTGDVEKRLDALADANELGSGYRLALMDLEIRGAGNVLGSEQHGHVERIGYEMYSRLLRETIALLQGDTVMTLTNTEVSANVDAYLSEKDISAERERLKLYKRIAALDGEEARKAFIKDYEDMYGPLPAPVANLLRVSLIRVLGSRCGVQKAEIDRTYLTLRFSSADYLKSAAVKQALAAVKESCSAVVMENRIEFVLLRADVPQKMEFLIRFLNYANGIYDL